VQNNLEENELKLLRVRQHLWRPKADGPRTELLHNRKWVPCHSLQAARTFARQFGYDGIKIEAVS